MPRHPRLAFCTGAALALFLVSGCDIGGRDGDDDGGGVPAAPAPAVSDELYALGQALFFDKELSGNRDVACATCHHPALGTDDDLPLSRGVGATGLGAARRDGALIARNAPALFNLHLYPTMFWDSRVAVGEDGRLVTPAGEALTPAMQATLTYGVVAAQAMFPVVSREEMRGEAGSNEVADVPDGDWQGVWSALMNRLGAIEGYVQLFEAAYPGTPFDEMTFAHAANAIAGFEMRAFEAIDSRYQRFLQGDEEALSEREREGMDDFFEECGSCHSGPLLSDFEHHNTGLAQLGPGAGHGPAQNDDFGREGVTGQPRDRYAFRTTPLLNVALTAPYGHAGQFADLEAFLDHYSNAERELRNYRVEQHVQDPALHGMVLPTTEALLLSLDRDVRRIDRFDAGDMAAFLEATTVQIDLSVVLVDEVPSGLPVD